MYYSKIWINEGKILVKTIEMGDGTYSQYDNDEDTYFKAILIEEYFEKMKTYFTDIKKELKSTRSWWQMKFSNMTPTAKRFNKKCTALKFTTLMTIQLW